MEESSPTLALTTSIGITFPFNLILGIPLYYKLAQFMG
ncbi:MAG: sodium-dependent bicarbonate transport family permease [Candidatus Planktophila sp.]